MTFALCRLSSTSGGNYRRHYGNRECLQSIDTSTTPFGGCRSRLRRLVSVFGGCRSRLRRLVSIEKSKCLCSGSPRCHILGCWISSPPPEFQLAFHIYYVKYENTLTFKRISCNSGGGGGNDVLKIFFYFLYV